MQMTESKECKAKICCGLNEIVRILTWGDGSQEQENVKTKKQNELDEEFEKITPELSQLLPNTPPLKCICAAKSEDDPRLILKRLMTLPLAEGSISDTFRDDIVSKTVETAPELIVNDDENGQTALHLALLQENGKDESTYKLLTKMIDKIPEIMEKTRSHLHYRKTFLASGSKFKGTKMEAGTVLGVAALSTSKNKLKIFERLLNAGFDLYQRTDNNDNILHSIIRHRQRHRDVDVHKSTMQIITKYIFRLEDIKRYQMLTDVNNAHLTPVLQAALYGDFEMYEFFMSTQAMRENVCSDGLMDVHKYDITDIETIPPRKENTKHETAVQNSAAKEESRPGHISVLEFVGHRQGQNVANEFVNFPPIKEVIQHKWFHYRILLSVWFIFHLLSTAGLCATAFYRTKFLSKATSCLQCSSGNGIHKAAYVLTLCELAIGVVYLFPILCEIVRLTCKRRYTIRPSFSHAYSNMLFRIMYCLFGPLLVLDAGLALIDVDSLILPFALIIACYLFLFFFQVIPTFSAFTVIIQRVIPDMLRFAFVMTALLFGFSMAMFVVMHGADPNDDSFDTFTKAMIKMVSIMIGLGEIDNLFTSQYPYVAIVIFILFVLLTTILLLNSLIAIMSNTCSLVTTSQRGGYSIYYQHCILQRLSVILYLEHICIADFCLKEVGEMEKSYFMNGKRRLCKIDTVSDVTAESEESPSASLTAQMFSSIFPIGNPTRRPRKKNKVKSGNELAASKSFGTPRNMLDIAEEEIMKCSNCGSKRIVSTADVPEIVSAQQPETADVVE